MLFYDFECDCGYETSDLDEMLASRVKECPQCKKMSLIRLIGCGAGTIFGTGLKDKAGEKIWFPKDGKPYFDRALGRTFESPQEKKAFMDSKNLAQMVDNPVSQKELEKLKREASYNASQDILKRSNNQQEIQRAKANLKGVS